MYQLVPKDGTQEASSIEVPGSELQAVANQGDAVLFGEMKLRVVRSNEDGSCDLAEWTDDAEGKETVRSNVPMEDVVVDYVPGDRVSLVLAGKQPGTIKAWDSAEKICSIGFTTPNGGGTYQHACMRARMCSWPP